MDDLEKQAARLRRDLRAVASTARRAVAGDRTDRVRFTGEINVQRAINVASPGAIQVATQSQSASVRQRPSIRQSAGSAPRSRKRQEDHMADERQDYRALSREELTELAGEELPERAAMSLINANVAIPINIAAALNVLSDNSTAYANAAQQTPIDQST